MMSKRELEKEIRAYKKGSIAFVYCVTCEENIYPSRIPEHETDGHQVEITRKPQKPNRHDFVFTLVFNAISSLCSTPDEAAEKACKLADEIVQARENNQI